MSSESDATETERDRWERIMSTGTEAAFREFVLDEVDPQPDESILSVGCGPGFETAALGQRLGEDGRVTGVDVDDSVLAGAQARCDDLPQVSLVRGDVTALPVTAESHDLAIAKQVLYGVSDVLSVLTELFRVLTPGGRLAVTASDRRTHVKHTPTDLLQRADDVYRSEMGDRQLGTRLRSLLPEAGFTVETVVPRAKHKTEIDDQIENGIDVQRRCLEMNDGFDADAIEAWERELRALDDADQFLSCTTAFLYVARKPR